MLPSLPEDKGFIQQIPEPSWWIKTFLCRQGRGGSRQSLRLEWYIVLLIGVEIVLFLYDLFLAH
jgi:hypothetical protein